MGKSTILNGFDKSLPDTYIQLKSELESLGLTRMNQAMVLNAVDSCDCECDACENCVGKEIDPDELEEVEANIAELDEKLADGQITLRRIERWAKVKNIKLEEKK